MTTNKTHKVWEAFRENTDYPEDITGWNLANALREVINQLQKGTIVGPVITCYDVLELCEELEKVK
jgi:hypothetical protein